MINQGKLKYYCDFTGCKSKKRVIKTAQDVIENHSHLKKIKTFNQLREKLLKEDHPIKKIKVNPHQQDIYSMIDKETINLINSFQILANNLKEQMINFVSSRIVSVKELFELYTSVIEQNDVKVEELQHLIPKLSISKKVMMNQEVLGQRVHFKVFQAFKELNDKVQALTKVDFKIIHEYRWCRTLKHADSQIKERAISNSTNFWNMNLLQPSLTVADVTKVKLRVTKLHNLYLSLCDRKIARHRRPTWDHRLNVGDGTYSHRQNGGIYPHHMGLNHSCGQILAFTFQEGDILELEWNGPLRQFITSRPSTNSRYVQNVKFDENSQIHFGVQMVNSAVEIIQ